MSICRNEVIVPLKDRVITVLKNRGKMVQVWPPTNTGHMKSEHFFEI